MAATSVVSEMTFGEVVSYKRYRLFLAAIFLDHLCDSFWLVTLGWIAAQAANPVLSGTILFAGSAPVVVLVIFGGAWVDRYGTNNVAVITLTLRVLAMAGWSLIVLLHAPATPLIAVAAAAVGLISGVHEPALFSFPTVLLPDHRGQAAAATVERSLHRGTQLIGGVGAGTLLGAYGAAAPTLVGAVLVLASLAIVHTLQRSAPQRRLPGDHSSMAGSKSGKSAAETPRTSATTGFRFTTHHPVLRYTIWVQSIVSIITSATILAILPLKAHAMGWSSAEYGYGVAAYGGGLTISTLCAFPLQRKMAETRVLIAVWMGLATSMTLALVALAQTPVWVTAACGVMGLALGPAGPFLTGYTRAVASTEQDATGEPIVGRVGAVLLLATDGAESAGFFVVSAAASVVSVDVATFVLAGIAVGVCGWCLARMPRAVLPGGSTAVAADEVSA